MKPPRLSRMCHLGAALLALAAAGLAQDRPVGRVKNFVVPDYDAQNRRKAVLYGEEAVSSTNGLWLINRLKIESYTGGTNPAWVVQAPACTYHDPSRQAWSPGPLAANSTDGQLHITGEGFEWRQTEQRLVISNQVRTLLRPPPREAQTPLAGLARNDLELTARSLVFQGQAMSAVYEGGVRVRERLPAGATNPPVTLDCEILTIYLSGQRSGVQAIEARQAVRFTQGATRVEGPLAYYSATNDVIEMTGGAHWAAELASGQAGRLVYDRARGQVHASERTVTRLSDATPPRAGETNAPLVLAAPAVTVLLPATNRPLTTLHATGGVEVSRGDWQAGGAALAFSGTATNGIAHLTGAPWWRTPQAQGTATELRYDRQNNLFQGRGQGVVQLQRPATPGAAAADGMTVRAEEYEMADDQAVFRGALAAEDAQWRMSGREMRVESDPRTRRARAVHLRGAVSVEQKTGADAAQVPWRLQCEELVLEMSADGAHLARIVAAHNTRLEPARSPRPGEAALGWRLQCDRAVLSLNTNQHVAAAEAEGRIYLETQPRAPGAAAWALTGERLTLSMAPGRTNQVERALVERQVSVRQLAGAGAREGLWHLNCQQAALRLDPASGEVREAEAEGGVQGVQYLTNQTQIAWTMRAGRAQLALGASNRVERVTAQRDVRLEQGFTTNGPPLEMASQRLSITLNASNAIETLVAQEQVVIVQGDSRATGATGHYRSSSGEFELSGQPALLYVERTERTNTPPRQLRIENAEVLVWNRLNHTFRGKGAYRIQPAGPLTPPKQP